MRDGIQDPAWSIAAITHHPTYLTLFFYKKILGVDGVAQIRAHGLRVEVQVALAVKVVEIHVLCPLDLQRQRRALDGETKNKKQKKKNN